MWRICNCSAYFRSKMCSEADVHKLHANPAVQVCSSLCKGMKDKKKWTTNEKKKNRNRKEKCIWMSMAKLYYKIN